MIVNILDYLEKSAINFPDKVGYCDEYEKVTFKTLKNRLKQLVRVCQNMYQRENP